MRPIKPFTFDITVEEIEEFTREAAKILGTGILILGEHISRFEQAFAEFIGVQHAVAVNSGTSALEILLLPPTLALVQAAMEQPWRSSQAPVVGVLWVHIGGVISPEFPAVVEYCRRLFVLFDQGYDHLRGRHDHHQQR